MLNIAIDGPAGAGKSSIAKLAAKRLGFIYVDTGALYRTVGYYAVEHGADPADEAAVQPLLAKLRVELKFVDGEQRVLLNGADVSGEIRTPEMAMAASAVSALPSVRAFLFDLQREIAANNNVIMDGRDIGTVVLPDAQLKIFLTASPEARAGRRLAEHQSKGEQVDFDTLLAEIQKRDYDDSHRAIAPLKQAEDAVLVDTTDYTLEQSAQRLLELIEAVPGK